MTTIEKARAELVGQMLVAMGSAPKNRGREMQITMARADDYALAVLDEASSKGPPFQSWDELRTRIKEPVEGARDGKRKL